MDENTTEQPRPAQPDNIEEKEQQSNDVTEQNGSSHGLDEILRAIHNAVLKAQQLTEQQHIRQLRSYFDDKGVARTMEIQVPCTDPAAKPGETVSLQVPLMSLVPPTAIKIKEMNVDFKVSLKGFMKSQARSSRNIYGEEEKHKGAMQVDMGGVSGGFFKNNENLANISIKFESGEPAESFLRINDQLIKSIV